MVAGASRLLSSPSLNQGITKRKPTTLGNEQKQWGNHTSPKADTPHAKRPLGWTFPVACIRCQPYEDLYLEGIHQTSDRDHQGVSCGQGGWAKRGQGASWYRADQKHPTSKLSTGQDEAKVGGCHACEGSWRVLCEHWQHSNRSQKVLLAYLACEAERSKLEILLETCIRWGRVLGLQSVTERAVWRKGVWSRQEQGNWAVQKTWASSEAREALFKLKRHPAADTK